jgi:GDP-4-dehydro-6-deoxy-D-mannose reductase
VQKILITGGGGFVAPYVATAARDAFSSSAEIVLADRQIKSGPESFYRRILLDVADRSSVQAIVQEFKPTHITHLAGVSSLPGASADPDAAWRVNVHGTLNIANAILAYTPDCTLQFASSGQVYGNTAKLGRAMREDDLLQPTNEYAVTKAAADLALGALALRGLKTVRFRPFNHTGPGQTEDFVLPNFAAQIARIEAGLIAPVIRVGNLEAERDFLDVRDVAAAYVSAMQRPDALENGEILNVASGKAHRVADLLEILVGMSSTKISIVVDPARIRPIEIAHFYGNTDRIFSRLNWRPQRSILDLLGDLLAEARRNALQESYTGKK